MPDPSPTSDPMAAFGPNEWLVDELYEQYKNDRNSVDKAWWSFFEDYRPGERGAANGAAPASAPTSNAPAQPPSVSGSPTIPRIPKMTLSRHMLPPTT